MSGDLPTDTTHFLFKLIRDEQCEVRALDKFVAHINDAYNDIGKSHKVTMRAAAGLLLGSGYARAAAQLGVFNNDKNRALADLLMRCDAPEEVARVPLPEWSDIWPPNSKGEK